MGEFLSVLTENGGLFASFFWTGIRLFAVGAVGALVLGIVLASMRVSPVPALRTVGGCTSARCATPR
ncbi:hypothetical protein GCM10025868_07170 [Angustibacter aerolatus]|uniref:Uncharacterized protein n=1 Tax=Angustibacter aerolatus TaxID=1162965 RepID=A0ABQ6JBB2_9ACTN|nr:hypothetical protein [Angustibacter aerolatus]GMA85467.1 hypothetical protein GCM10025868_07170 [Angustibacter aerolatus]